MLCLSDRSRVFAATLFAAALAAGAVHAQVPTKTWNGSPGGSWHDGNNWVPPGEPGATDHVLVPPDRGEIRATKIKVRSLRLADSADGDPGNNTRLVGATAPPPANRDLDIDFGPGGDMTIGAGCKVQGADGADGVAPIPGPAPVPGTNGEDGGSVTIRANGRLTIDGALCGGDGGDGPELQSAGHGGSVRFDGGVWVNNGEAKGGDGGHKTGRKGPCWRDGGKGGSIRVQTHPNARSFNRLGVTGAGVGGSYTPGGDGGHHGRRGPDGDTFIYVFDRLQTGDRLSGRSIFMDDSVPIDFGGADAGAFAGETVRIKAPSVDFRGLPAGTDVFQSRNVQVTGATQTDPGVTLDDYSLSAVFYLGGQAAAESTVPAFGPQTFENDAPSAPLGWNAGAVQGSTCFQFDNPSVVPLDPRMGCNAAIVDAQLNPVGPLLAVLESPRVRTGDLGPILLEWTQWHQASASSQVGVVVVADGTPTPVYTDNAGTQPFDFVQIDVTALVQPAEEFFVRFVFNGTNQGFWAVDDVAVRIPVLSLPGQPAQPGIALLDVDDARNTNNVPVWLGQPGPYFTDVAIGEVMGVHVQTAPSQFVFLLSGVLQPDVFQFPGIGQLDIALPMTVGSYFSDPLGNVDLPYLVPPHLAGLDLALQAAVTHPVLGLQATNAVQIRFGD